jgi:hypothetical protein
MPCIFITMWNKILNACCRLLNYVIFSTIKCMIFYLSWWHCFLAFFVLSLSKLMWYMQRHPDIKVWQVNCGNLVKYELSEHNDRFTSVRFYRRNKTLYKTFLLSHVNKWTLNGPAEEARTSKSLKDCLWRHRLGGNCSKLDQVTQTTHD